VSRVLVTGGTGVLGRPTVQQLVAAGHDVRVLSRSGPMAGTAPGTDGTGPVRLIGDLADGRGLTDALAGVDAVVHCATDPRRARAVDVTGTELLVRAAGEGGVRPHVVFVSIVGVDRIPWSYYRAKHRAEEVVQASGLPWTVQRATQFHPFVAQMLWQLARTPVMALPRGFRFQPMAASDLAARLVSHVADGPAGQADALGGPQVLDLGYLARSWMQATGLRRRVLALPVPGRVSAAFRSGANLCPDHAEGTGSWEQYLDELRRRAAVDTWGTGPGARADRSRPR
jgi:uncharacterized protein YbjT (DUF2867 family)